MSGSPVRRYATATGAGALMGALWIGVVSRLVMAYLAHLNPEVKGVQSDDDFTIGQVTLQGSLNLLVVGVLIGSVGGALYLALRGLRVGPPWFQLVSVTLGPALVALALLVHPDGVDFTRLHPLAAAVGLFLVVAWGYTLSLALLAERWLRPGGFGERAPRWLVVAAVPSLGFFPLPIAMAVGYLVRQQVPALPSPVLWVARAALAVVFALAVVNLGSDLADLRD